MNFKKWLEVGMGGGGVGGGIDPVKQNPLSFQGAWQDYHLNDSKEKTNAKGKLPPIKSRKRSNEIT